MVRLLRLFGLFWQCITFEVLLECNGIIICKYAACRYSAKKCVEKYKGLHHFTYRKKITNLRKTKKNVDRTSFKWKWNYKAVQATLTTLVWNQLYLEFTKDSWTMCNYLEPAETTKGTNKLIDLTNRNSEPKVYKCHR